MDKKDKADVLNQKKLLEAPGSRYVSLVLCIVIVVIIPHYVIAGFIYAREHSHACMSSVSFPNLSLLKNRHLSVSFSDIAWCFDIFRKVVRLVKHACLQYFSLEQSEWHRQKRGLTERGGRASVLRKQSAAQQIAEENIHLWTDSPWPARNNQVFGALNSFMERCNDVLELVQTTTHFKMLRLASEIGGAGGTNLNSLVEEIYGNFQEAIEKIQGYNLVRKISIILSPGRFLAT